MDDIAYVAAAQRRLFVALLRLLERRDILSPGAGGIAFDIALDAARRDGDAVEVIDLIEHAQADYQAG